MSESGGAPAPTPAAGASGATEVSGLTGSGSVTNPSAGRGSGGRGRHNRRFQGRGGRGNRDAGQDAEEHNNGLMKSSFKGQVEGLEDFVFDLINPADSIDRFESTAERLAECIATKWTGAAPLKDETLPMEEQSYPEPAEPDPNPSTWRKELAKTNGVEWVKDMRKLSACRGRAIDSFWGQCANSV